MHLLIIDDSRLDRKLIKRLVNQIKLDVNITEADSVETALSMVAVEHFDCILIDYHLRGTDGVDLACQIKASHGGVTPMVMLTADPSPALTEQALGSGLTDFMSKRSLTSEQLRQALCNAMVKRRVARIQRPGIDGDMGDHQSCAPETRQVVMQALSLLDQSSAVQQCLLEDQGAQTAIDMLRKAVTTPQMAP